MDRLYFSEELPAVHQGHHHLKKHEVQPPSPYLFERGSATRGKPDVTAESLKRCPQEGANIYVIVNHQDDWSARI
jgi:hypothetical protein